MGDVSRETTPERATRLRHSGARMCGPKPPTEGDLDAVEEFLRYLKVSKLADQVKSVADMHIENGANPQVVRMHVKMMTGVSIGEGGSGTDPSIPPCPYCGAFGGGGHGGSCPGA